MRRRRGSIAVFVLFMVASTMLVVIATISLTGAIRGKQVRLENNRVVLNIFDGAFDVVRDMAFRGILRLPQTVTTTINGTSVSLQLTDASYGVSTSILGVTITTSSTGQFVKASATLTYKGATYRSDRVIDRGVLSTVWQYALYSDTSISTGNTISTGSAGLGGDVWINGSVTLTGLTNRIRGDLTSTGSILALTTTVDGSRTANSNSISFPNAPKDPYQNASIAQPTATTQNGYAFPAPDSTGYPIVYFNNSVSLSGSFSGTGVIYVHGDCTISGSISVGAGGHMLIACDGNMNVNNSATVGAYLYCMKTLTVGAAAGSTTFTAGVVAQTFKTNNSVSMSYDPWIRDNPVEAYNLRMPGVWP